MERFQPCGSKGSLARDFSTFYIQKEDCDGTPVVQASSKYDACGVCGGLNNCIDCRGKVNGSEWWLFGWATGGHWDLALAAHVFECDRCVERAGTAKNCAGLCGDGYQVVTRGGRESCLPKGMAAQVACDGVVNSSAVINR
jgi:hypothetical protein